MTASIVLSNLTLSTPDDRLLLQDIDLRLGSERTGLVGRNGVGKTTLLQFISGERRPRSGTVLVSGTIGNFRQLVQVEPRETIADLFGAARTLEVLRRADLGQATADELAQVDWTLEGRLNASLQGVGLDIGLETRLATLSGGQRTRAALAALVFSNPDFLLLDEPTNNLDREGRTALYEMMATWRSGAVVVSHDRELLEMMDAVVELTSLGVRRYGGNWTAYREYKARELEAAQRDLVDAEKTAAGIARKAQTAIERQARKDGAGRRKAAKGGAPRILLGGMKERSENSGGERTRLAEVRRSEATDAVAAARARIEILQPLSMVLPMTGLPPTKTVLELDSVTAGHSANQPVIRDLSFSIVGPERVAITGPNGSGKSTLLAILNGSLPPRAGRVHVATGLAMLDQHVGLLEPSLSIRDNFRRINPEADENACRAALARFMFRAEAALQIVSTLSGGQLLRAGLACVLSGETPPPLLLLDEPTNHLDLTSIEAVEAGLRAYDGALVVVSHDEAFLAAIGISRRLELSPSVAGGSAQQS